MTEIALHWKKENTILRAVVSADFAKGLLEQNFQQDLVRQFLSKAVPVSKERGHGAGSLLIDEVNDQIVSAQTAFALASLENIFEPWEYVDLSPLEKIRVFQ